MTTQAKLTTKVMAKFEGEFRNVLALQRLSVPELWKRIGAVVELDEGMKGELEMRASGIDQKNYYARNVEQDSFVKCLFEASCRAFHTLQERGVITFATALTQEALTELENMEIIAGVAPPRPILPTAKTAEVILYEQVMDDWKHLPTDKLKRKCATDPAYKAAFDRLMANGVFASNSAHYQDLSQVGR